MIPRSQHGFFFFSFPSFLDGWYFFSKPNNFRQHAENKTTHPYWQRDMMLECALRVAWLVNLKFNDRNSINASVDIHITIHTAIHRYVYWLMGVINTLVFEQERSFLLVLLLKLVFSKKATKIDEIFTVYLTLITLPNVKSMAKIFSNSVAFLKNIKFQ